MTQDTRQNITKVLQLFKECHPDNVLDKTSVFFVDKDQKEISSIRLEFPNSEVLLCWFHVLKSFKGTVAELEVPQTTKKEIFALLQKLLHSETEEIFGDHFYELMQVAPKHFYQYMMQNWTNIKPMWVWYDRKKQRTLGNNTTNRIEALNRALKQLFRAVKRTRMNFSECVTSLLKFLTLSDNSLKYSEFINAEKTPYVHHAQYGEQLTQLGKTLTQKALRLILYQLQKYDEEKALYKVDDFGHGAMVIKNTKSDNSYSIQTEISNDGKAAPEEIMTCSCSFNSTFGLFCRHIMHA